MLARGQRQVPVRTYRVDVRIATLGAHYQSAAELLALARSASIDRSPPAAGPEWEIRLVTQAISEASAERWARAECERLALHVVAVRVIDLAAQTEEALAR
jgi:hypothetical protein